MRENITPYEDINNILLELANRILKIIDKDLIGFYLFGSLSYGDFNPDSSDIDLVVVTKNSLNPYDFKLIKSLHENVESIYKKWYNRVECSYVPINMLNNILPPKQGRPYFGGGIFYEAAIYGNEWTINNYLLYHHAIPLVGPSFNQLIKPINIKRSSKACIMDLFLEWEPKLTDYEWMENSHHQSYIILNLCRILYTVICGQTSTKVRSAKWVKKKFKPYWCSLITKALNWKYEEKLALKNEINIFLKFIIEEIKKQLLYKEISSP